VAKLRAAVEQLARRQTVTIVLDLPGGPPVGAETLPDGKWALAELGDEAGPEPEPPAVTRGQRPRPPSPEQREEALATLRQRAAQGLYVGVLPASEAELRAEQERREALRKDAALIRHMGRPAALAPAQRLGLRGWVLGR
jgi:hypothetical protein